MAINSIRNEEFPVKTLEDQQKIYVAFMRLISTLDAFGHCAIWKYIYHTWMEGVVCNQLTPRSLQGTGTIVDMVPTMYSDYTIFFRRY